jgi:hypothetical protein
MPTACEPCPGKRNAIEVIIKSIGNVGSKRSVKLAVNEHGWNALPVGVSRIGTAILD